MDVAQAFEAFHESVVERETKAPEECGDVEEPPEGDLEEGVVEYFEEGGGDGGGFLCFWTSS